MIVAVTTGAKLGAIVTSPPKPAIEDGSSRGSQSSSVREVNMADHALTFILICALVAAAFYYFVDW
jgi:hypothetical protein